MGGEKLSFTRKMDFNDSGIEFLNTTVNIITAFAITRQRNEEKFINYLKIKCTHSKPSTGMTERHLLVAASVAQVH